MGKEDVDIVCTRIGKNAPRSAVHRVKAQPPLRLHLCEVRKRRIAIGGEPLRQCQKEDLTLRRLLGHGDRDALPEIRPSVDGDTGIRAYGEHHRCCVMRVPVELLCRPAQELFCLKIIDLGRVHAAILKQLKLSSRIPLRLDRHIGGALQDGHIRRTVVAVVGERERIRMGGMQEECTEQCGQEGEEQRETLQSAHSPTSLARFLCIESYIFRLLSTKILVKKVLTCKIYM